MTREERCAKRQEAVQAFAFAGRPESCRRYGSGHINDTFLLCTRDGEQQRRYILQRLNHEVFRKPREVMENIAGITAFLREAILARGGDPERETLNLVRTKDGDVLFCDSIGSYWRMYRFIDGCISPDTIEHPGQFYQSALAFGRFQSMLRTYPAHTLHETIADFHNTPDRLRKLRAAVQADPLGRAAAVQAEIDAFLQQEAFARVLVDSQAAGAIPLRVTHNDTKLNNVMLDAVTGEAVCILDLDTVMPGLSVNDFGDAIRFGASTAAEDERDLAKVKLDLTLYECFTKGFLEGCDGSLTPAELELLPTSAKIMTLECGMRFLTDYLEGDVYYNTHRPGQNLDRCRTQLKLVREMEQNWQQMGEIVARYAQATGKES